MYVHIVFIAFVYTMVKLQRIIVKWKSTVCLDMRRNVDGTWDTFVARRIPKRMPKKYKTGSWRRLMRLHKKGLTR